MNYTRTAVRSRTCHTATATHMQGKASPYSTTERRVTELIPVPSSQPAVDVSHKPGGRLPLLSARPAVILATLERAAANFAAWRTGMMGVNSLPKTVTRQRRGCDLNPGPSAHRQSKEASILWSHHDETREMRGERDNARNNARCTQARKATHGLDGQLQDVARTLRGRVNQNWHSTSDMELGHIL